ncbi:btb (poz) domain-containing 2a-related [Anaeramoeba flamelloides]|uniref:Btb (Poz) domain-containing 2a-related n=1 Tax=Anaeramoeba flamelloides TaxID=1746091 RepID=A0AAV7YFC8_9EUKA|nr:btb (poz) domain-containing 2a-related [Anaeramoeba flamelloides]
MYGKITPISKKLKPFVNNSDLADVKFYIGKDETEFYGHKLLLAITSTMWRTMFYSSNWNETKNNGVSEVKIPDIESDVFDVILQFSYVREIELKESTAVKVLKAADKFLMEELKEFCFEYLVNNLNKNNAINLYEEMLNMNNQKQIVQTLRYISTRREVLMAPNCLSNVSKQTILNILDCKELLVKEIQLFQRLIERIVLKTNFNTRNSSNENEDEKEQKKEKEKENKYKSNEKQKNNHEFSELKIDQKEQENENENENENSMWFEADQCLKELLDDFPFQFSIVRCLKVENIKRIDKNDLELLTKIQWTRFIDDEYQYILDTKLFDMEKIKLYRKFTNGFNQPLAYLGINGNIEYKLNIQSSRKPRIKKTEIKVLLMAAHNNILRREDVMRSIRSTGITHVNEINLCENTPSYHEIKGYDAILFFSLSALQSPKKVGNLLADFVDELGGVVICSINSLRNDSNDGRELKGRIIKEDYLPVKKGKEICQERRTLGIVENKTHFIMNGVKSFDAGRNSWHIKTKKVTENAKIICRYDNGNIMIAEKVVPNRGKVVVLNFFPVSDSVRNNDEYWLTNTDGYNILANSIEYVAQK